MADDLPNTERAIYIFLEMIALGFVLEAVGALMRGDPWWKWVGGLAIGTVSMILGVKSKRITSKLSGYLNSRLIWMIMFELVYLYCLYSIQRVTPDFAMTVHQRFYGAVGYIVIAITSAVLACGVWWFAGRKLAATTIPRTIPITDPKDREAILRVLKDVYQAKAAYLENPLVRKAQEARRELRTSVEEIEVKVGCLIDTVNVECAPKPPKVIDTTKLEINISTMVVAEELHKSRFWIVRKRPERSKFRVPIVVLVSLTNRNEEPTQIKLLYLEAKSADDKWADIRMADSLNPSHPVLTMDEAPLVMEKGANSCVVMKNDYLLPSLYNRLLQPAETITGWVVAEFPKGLKYGNLIGVIRISMLDANSQWISAKTFAAHPPAYPIEDAGPIVESNILTPFDFFIDED